jgi:transcriptional regulator of acetoin/glycerol metabolism
LTRSEIADKSGKIETILKFAEPEIRKLLSRLYQYDYWITVASQDGVNVLSRCDYRLMNRMEDVGLRQGAVWSENLQGTNAVGTALKLQKPISVLRDEHFLKRIHAVSCTAVPIFGPNGEIKCVLNASTNRLTDREAQHFLMSIMERSAVRIEHSFFSEHYSNERILRLSQSDDFSDPSNEIQLAIDGDDNIIDVSSKTCAFFNIEREDIVGRSPYDFFDFNLEEMAPNETRRIESNQSDHNRILVQLREPSLTKPHRKLSRSLSKPLKSSDNHGVKGFDASVLSLHPEMLLTFERVRPLISAGVPIVLRGELGSGRELFAKELSNILYNGSFKRLRCGLLAPGNAVDLPADTFANGLLYLDSVDLLPQPFYQSISRMIVEQLDDQMKPGFCVVASYSNAEQKAGNWLTGFLPSAPAFEIPSIRTYPNIKEVILHLFHQIVANKREGPKSISDAVVKILSQQIWPGNIEQIKLTLQVMRAASDGDTLELKHLPATMQTTHCDGAISTPTKYSEGDILNTALEKHDWNVTKTSDYLGISRATLNRKIRSLKLKRPPINS